MRLNIYKKNFAITILCIYMLTKMLWDTLVPNIFELISLAIIAYGIFMYFKEIKFTKNSFSIVALIVLFSIYILFNSFTKDNTQQMSRALYEYIFYLFIIFAANYYLQKTDIHRMIKILNGLGIVIVVLSWYEYLTKSYLIGSFSNTILYSNNSAFRAAVFSRSYLCHGIMIGFFSLLSFFLLLDTKKKKYLFQTVITYGTILTTSSRGPLVATGVALLVMYLANEYRQNNSIDKKVLKWCSLAVLALIIFSFLTSTFTTGNETIDYFLYRTRKIIDWSGDAGNVGRIRLWNNAIEWFKTDILFGIGASKTGSWGTGSLGVTESGVLKRLCELGIVGFLLFYTLIFRIVKVGIRNYKLSNYCMKLIYILFFGIFIMIMINDITVQSTEEIMVSFLLMLSLGGMNIRMNDEVFRKDY